MSRYPDNMNWPRFDNAYGVPSLRAEAEADEVTTVAMKRNRAIADALTKARQEIEAIGEPSTFTNDGYEYRDVLTMLRDMTPDLTPAAERRVWDAALAQAMEGV